MLKSLSVLLALTAPSIAAGLGDDGLHKAPWMVETFKDLSDDLSEANSAGKRLMVIIEQRSCIYCARMHEEVFEQPPIDSLLREKFFVIQINMFGDVDVTDFDGTTLSEKDMVQRWNILLTPTMMFFPQAVLDAQTAPAAAVATVPGAFGKQTTYNMLTWVLDRGYEGDESFQRYHARMLEEGHYPE